MIETRFEGIVIGHQNWGDADRLISFYTPQHGKLEIVARGVRYEKSKLKGHLDILTRGEFRVAKNRGKGVLTDAVSLGTFFAPETCPEAVYLGSAIADMYYSYLYPFLPDAALWEALYMTLGELGDRREMSYEDARGILAVFARKFLKQLGYLADGGKEFSLQAYDGLLAHTEINGPVFVEIAQRLRDLSPAAA